MHPRRSAQSVLLCDLCETVPLQSRCELCRVNLCSGCVEKHLSDSSKGHKVGPFVQRKADRDYPKCPAHPDKHCKLYCEKCGTPVCSTCLSSDQHKDHDLSDVLKKLKHKTESLQRDLEELETRIYPQYESMASDIRNEKADLDTNYGKLTTTADQQGDVLHREITTIVSQRKSDIREMKSEHLAVLDKQTDDITKKMTELKQIIQELKKILDTDDVSLDSTYQSRNAEFRKLPPKVLVTFPSSSPQMINTDRLKEMFGSLSSLSITAEEHDDTMASPEAVSSLPVKPLLDEPRITAPIDTGYDELRCVSCLGDEEVWTSGTNKIMKLLDLQGKLLTSIQTESGNMPWDIAVTRSGDLVYTDPEERTVNLVKNKQIQTLIRLQSEWNPWNVCSTSSGDLLVVMVNNDHTQSKVVRYAGSTATQSIQFDDQDKPLYSSGTFIKYISENKNLDICVADYEARAVVVVNQSGKFRFRYTGHPPDTKESFYPYGITTDSQSHILTADCDNGRIHILDQDGQFLRYIQNLRRPVGLCVDIRDNLFVADTPKVKKIQYL